MPNIANLITEELSKEEGAAPEIPAESNAATEDAATEPDVADEADGEENPEASAPEGDATEEGYEIPGVGEFTLDELKAALDAQGRLTDAEAKLASAEMTTAELEEARTLQSMLQFPAFRRELQALVDRFEKLTPEDASKGEPGELDLSGIKDPRVDQLLKEVEPLRKIAADALIKEKLAEHDRLRDSYIERFPKIVTKELWDSTVQSLLKEHGKALQFRDIEFAVTKHIAEKGITQATQNAIAEAAKKGSRLLVRPKPAAGAPPKPAGKLSRADFQNLLVATLEKA